MMYRVGGLGRGAMGCCILLDLKGEYGRVAMRVEVDGGDGREGERGSGKDG